MEALMDLGRVYCQKSKVSCHQCPMVKSCLANKEQKVLQYPGIEKKKAMSIQAELLRVVVEKEGKFLALKRDKSQWLAGQWELPTFCLRGEVPEHQYRKIQVGRFSKDNKFKSVITHYKFENYVEKMSEQKVRKIFKYETLEFVRKDNLSTSSLKALRIINEN